MENMMNLSAMSIASVVVLCVFIQWLVSEKLLRYKRRLPPGPTPLPIIGNLHNLSKKPHQTLAELAKIHGPLMFLRLGFTNTVVVSSPEVAQEVLQKNDTCFSDRFPPDCFHALSVNDYCMAMMPANHRWRTVRKITNTLLLSGKNLDANQSIRMKKIKDLISYVSSCSKAGVAVNLGQVAFDASLNLLSNTFFSIDLAEPNSELSREFKEVSGRMARDSGKINISDYFPIFRRFDLQRNRKQMTSHIRKLFAIFDDIINKRLAERSDNTTKRNDVLDSLLDICLEKNQDYELRQVRYLLLEAFVAGTDTTTSTLEWAMSEVLHAPTKLKIAQEELNRVVGSGKLVTEGDFSRLPYMQAILKENFRLHPSVPLLVPRKANSDTDVMGFKIPKGSQLLVNVWAIGRDASLWTNPNKFEPERFLDTEIDVKGNHFELIPFGSGRRICVGIPLALRVLPLMLGNLLNFFEWKLEDGMKPDAMDMEEKFGMALQKATPLHAIPIKIIV